MSKKKKILITGAAGCLGRSLMDCLSDDYEVTGVYHKKMVPSGNYLLKKMDLITPVSDSERYDVIIHAAACLQGTAAEMVKSNVIATSNIIDFAEKTDASVFIYVSTVSVYGRCIDLLKEESSINSPEKYGTSKLLGEHLVEESTIPHRFVVRMPRILSKYMDMGANYSGLTVMVRKALNDECVVCDILDMPYNNYMYSDDIGEFIRCLLDRIAITVEDFEIVNLGATQNLTMKEVLEAIKVGAGSTSEIIPSKGGHPPCSLIDITKARRMGLKDRDEKERLKEFGRSIKMRDHFK